MFIREIVISMRPRQWTKNLAVFGALVFSQTASEPGHLGKAVAAFAVFCVLSGGVYLINDLLDLKGDRVHPVKRNRPLASGRLKPTVALGAAVLLATAAVSGSAFLGAPFLLVAVAYLVLQLAYSIRLKHTVIVDAFAIAAGFVLRAVAGAEAISVEISSWLLICTMLLALFLALSKRRHELTSLTDFATGHRKILSEYSTGLLDQMISVVTSATVLSYALYTMSAETVAKFGTNALVYTVPFVLYGIFRYLYLVHQKDGGGSPDAVLLTDPPLIACIALYGLALWVILY